MNGCNEKARFGFAAGVIFILALALNGGGADAASGWLDPPTVQGPNWERYVVNDEEFSVSLPELPAMMTTSYSVRPWVVRRQRILGAYANGVVYAIYCYENPKRAEPLTYFIADFKNHYDDGEMSFARDLQMPEVEGRQYRLQKREVPGTVRFYMTKDRAYVVEAMGAAENHSEVERFYSSFELDKNPRGNRVNDGPGAEIPDEVRQPSPPLGSGSGISGALGKTPDVSGAVFRNAEVTRKAIVVTKPEPPYTEEARKHGVMGTVVVKAVFSGSGRVTRIRAVTGLPDGLTDKAIAAAKQLRFVPAMKDGRFVSMYVQLEYTFTLY